MDIKDKIMNTLLELVAVPGIAGTKSEGLTAKKNPTYIRGHSLFSKTSRKS